MLNFGVSKPRVKGGPGPPGSPLDPHLNRSIYSVIEKKTLLGPILIYP